MYRRTVRPYGQSVSNTRLVSLLMAIAVLFMLYYRLKDPAMWTAFAEGKETAAPTPVAAEPVTETIVPGPNDLDEDEAAKILSDFEFVTDRAPLKSREMGAYYRMMDWARTQPFTDLEQRAKDDVPFAQLWEQPELYRGKPIRLRLHVRRVIEYDPPKNPSNIGKVYEAWGWTDESKSFPYVVVFNDLPEGMPIGTDVRAEITFVGYFMKVMTYQAFDKARGAPLLIGRARSVAKTNAATSDPSEPWTILAVVIGAGLIIAVSVWLRIRSRKTTLRSSMPVKAGGDQPPADFNFDTAFNEPEGSTTKFAHAISQAYASEGESATATLAPPETNTDHLSSDSKSTPNE